jgi:hypothetical protein
MQLIRLQNDMIRNYFQGSSNIDIAIKYRKHQNHTVLRIYLTFAAVLAVVTLDQAKATSLFSDDFDGANGGFGALNFAGFDNWDVSGATSTSIVDLIGNGFYDYQPNHGLYVDLDGSTFSQGTLTSKALLLAPGTYTLSFLLAGNNAHIGGHSGYTESDEVEVSIGGLLAAQTYALAYDQPFALFSRTFTVNSVTPAKIVFAAKSPISNNTGLLLDEVRLEAVPDAGSTAVFLGLAMAGLGLVGFGRGWARKREAC